MWLEGMLRMMAYGLGDQRRRIEEL